MGMYDTVGQNRIQVKVNADGKHVRVGDKIDLKDGLYICYEGYFVVDKGIVLCEGKNAFTKWGDSLYTSDILYKYNPGVDAIEKLEKEKEKNA